jgi:hypothetical protein
MAWVTKYQLEWADIFNVQGVAYIQEDAFAGSVTTLKGTGTPVKFEYLSDSDDILDPIKETRVKLNVLSFTHFALSDLYSVGDMQFRVLITIGGNTVFDGFILPGCYEEPYEDVPYPSTITASDGLGLLKNILYKYTTVTVDDTYYTGRRLESQIILDILGKIGKTSFTEYVNIYEDSMDSAVDDSPMDQLYLDADLFAEMYCYEVLQEIFKKYSAVIRQKAGVFCIYRPTELAGTTVYGRTFTGATTKTGTSFAPQQHISRAGNLNNRLQVKGSNLMTIAAGKKISLHQDYCNKESWIKNYDLLASTYQSAGYTFTGWTAYNCQSVPLSFYGINDNSGMLLITQNVSPTLAFYMYQTFGYYAKTSSDVFSIEIDFQFYNTGSLQTGVHFYVEISLAGHYLYLVDSEYAGWDHSVNYIDLFADAPNGLSGWTTISRKINTLPADGPLTVKVFGIWNSLSTVAPVIRNIKFVATNDSIAILKTKSYTWPFGFLTKWKKKNRYREQPDIVTHEYTKYNSINGKEIVKTMILGDVTDTDIDDVLDQFQGSMAVPTRTLHYRVDTINLTGNSGDAAVTCNGVTSDVLVTWNPAGLTQTAADFVAAAAADYLPGVVVTHVGGMLILTCASAGVEFTGNTTIANNTPNLSGTVVMNSTTAYTDVLDPSTTWSTRGGAEANPIIDVIAEEMKTLYARSREFIQMSIQERELYGTALNINPLGNFKDTMDTYGGTTRVFVMNAAEFDVRFRRWSMDLVEII